MVTFTVVGPLKPVDIAQFSGPSLADATNGLLCACLSLVTVISCCHTKASTRKYHPIDPGGTFGRCIIFTYGYNENSIFTACTGGPDRS